MRINKLLIGLLFSIGFISCQSDEILIEDVETAKSYEFISIEWKLAETDGQRIVEEEVPEYYFRNDSDTTMEINIEPLNDMQGSSIFIFFDSLAFKELNYTELEVSIPSELSLLSERYSYLSGGVKVPLAEEETFFPFSWHFKDSLMLNPRSTLTSNYTLFFRKNKASFLVTFREKTSGHILELKGRWTGLFFNNIVGESVINEIN